MLEVRGITKAFGARVVLRHVSFEAKRGGCVALLGPSGIGKTTLLRIVAGLERCDEGTISWDGKLLTSPHGSIPPDQRNLSLVFQDLALWPHMRAWKHLEFVLRGRGLSRKDRISRSNTMLGVLGLSHRQNAHPGEMSGGEQQRLALARALITDPSLLLLDEPFANLDASLRNQIVGELNRRMQGGTLIVLATHDPEEAAQLHAETLQLTVP